MSTNTGPQSQLEEGEQTEDLSAEMETEVTAEIIESAPSQAVLDPEANHELGGPADNEENEEDEEDEERAIQKDSPRGGDKVKSGQVDGGAASEHGEEAETHCPICFDVISYDLQQPPTCRLPCQHMFHASCVMDIRKFSSCPNACPLCRTAFPPRADELFCKAMSRYCILEKRLLSTEKGKGTQKISWNNLPPIEEKVMEKIISMFHLAAEQGHAEAMLNLGYFYSKGRGIAQSNDLAVHWYRFSAAQNYPKALLNLGIMYKLGRGVQKDNEKALELFTEAAERGYDKAQYKLGYMHKNGSHGCSQNYEKAIKWYRKAAVQGHADAQCSLGAMYRWGYGVESNDVTAVKYYLQAAEQDHSTAQRNLGFMFQNGCGVEQCLATAAHWFGLAAAAGDKSAQLSLTSIQNTSSRTRASHGDDKRVTQTVDQRYRTGVRGIYF